MSQAKMLGNAGVLSAEVCSEQHCSGTYCVRPAKERAKNYRLTSAIVAHTW